jgi:hypothetical protein
MLFPLEVAGFTVTATVGYGGRGLAPYALIQHENTEFNHPNGGQHHYLSQPFFEATAGMTERIGAYVMNNLRGV